MAARDSLRAWAPRWLRQTLALALGSRRRVAVTPDWAVRRHQAIAYWSGGQTDPRRGRGRVLVRPITFPGAGRP